MTIDTSIHEKVVPFVADYPHGSGALEQEHRDLAVAFSWYSAYGG